MNLKKRKMLATVATPVVLLPALVLAGSFTISRHTIDGGGTMHSTGSGYELSGTIGQPDANPASAMTGGSYTLTGGFWFPLVPEDCNSDGSVNLLDYGGFEACMAGPQGGMLSDACACYDRDGNGQVDVRDFGDFQSSLQLP